VLVLLSLKLYVSPKINQFFNRTERLLCGSVFKKPIEGRTLDPELQKIKILIRGPVSNKLHDVTV
jgi:hypothetical protein